MGRPTYKSHGGPRKPLAIRLREGVRVTVLLPKENRWFTGAVLKYDTKKALHTIVNDFGDAKRVDLRVVRWKLDGIEDCTEADIEAALDKGRRWHKSQSAEFLEAMTSPNISPRDDSRKLSDDGEGGAWDPSRLRVRKESREWYSSSEGESGGHGDMCSMEEEDEFMDADTASYDPPDLMKISASGFDKSVHLDFDLGEADDEALRGFCDKMAPRSRGRKRSSSLKPEGAMLKRPVGRPPKERKGYAAIKYAQDVAAQAISKMAKDELCNFNVIPSSIPFVEELQLIFGISRRLKVEKQRMANQGGAELAGDVQRECENGAESSKEGDVPESEEDKTGNGTAGAEQQPVGQFSRSNEGTGAPAAVAVASPQKASHSAPPMHQSPSCAVRESWHQSLHSSLVA